MLKLTDKDGNLLQVEVAKFIKSITTLANLFFIYLCLTWGYAAAEFLLRSILQ